MAKKVQINVSDVQRVREILRKKNITQKKLAEMAGVTEQQISRCFKNDRFPPQTKLAVFKALGISIDNSTVAKNIEKNLPSFVGFVEYKGTTEKLSSISDLTKFYSRIQNDFAPTEVKANGKDLMQTYLTDIIPKALQFTRDADVSELRRFLVINPTKPLIAVGIGGSRAASMYAKSLYGMYNSIATSVTPYMLNAISDEAIRNSKVLFITTGRDMDVKFAIDRVIQLTEDVACLTNHEGEDNHVLNMVRTVAPQNGFVYDDRLKNNAFISIVPIFSYMTLLYKAFTNKNDVIEQLHADKISMKSEENYIFETNLVDLTHTCPKLSNIKNFFVLYGVSSETIAYDIKSKLTESGIATALMSDYRNFTHGEFIYTGNHIENDTNLLIPSDTAMVLLVTPREYQIVNEIRTKALAPQTPLIIIRTEIENEALAVIDLLKKENVLICDIGTSRGINVASPPNYSNIDKRGPKYNVEFQKDFSSKGCLRASWDGTVVASVSQKENAKEVKYKMIDRLKARIKK